MLLKSIRILCAGVVSVMSALSLSYGESLKDAMMLAYETNPTLRSERARQRATRESRAQAVAGALPKITASSAYSQVHSEQISNFGGAVQMQDTTYAPLTAGVEAEQPIFAGFRNFHAIKQAAARIRAGGAQLAAAEQEVLLGVAEAYLDVLLQETAYAFNARNVEVLQRQQAMAAARFDVGEITRTDVAQADARLAAARAELTASLGALAVARAAYVRLVGQAPGALEPVEASPTVPETLDEALAIARQYSPRLIAAREQSEVSRRDIKIARGALLPSVSVTAGYQYADQPSNFIIRDEQFAYGARASMPLFLGGLNYSRIREAKAKHESDQSQVQAAERDVVQSVTAAWQQLTTARAVISSAQSAAAANAMALEGVRQESMLGTRTTLDVLNAEQERLNADLALARARRDEIAAAFHLLAAIGLLTPDAAGDGEAGQESDR